MKKKSILIWPMIIMSSVSYAEIYEDAEDGNTDGWTIIGKHSESASISNVYDADKQSNIIQLNGNGLKNRYRLGHLKKNSPEAWNNTEDNTLTWSMNYAERFIVNVLLTTQKGKRIIRYTPDDNSNGFIKRKSLHIGLGAQAQSGTWQTFTRNLEADLNTFDSNNKIVAIQGFTVFGSGSVDDIETYNDGTITVPSVITPLDSNIELGNESGILYYADPRVEENGLNRALRLDYNDWSFEGISVQGINPHSIDRAGATDKFYMRTQNSYSFDVVNFKEGSVKTVSLGDHKPRAIGAHNQKYNIQLLSGKNMPVVSVIDVATDTVIETVGDRNNYDKTLLTSNAGSGSATGHALWLDEDHFGLIDRVNLEIVVYKVTKDTDGNLSFNVTSKVLNDTAYHTVEKVQNPVNKKDYVTFYGMAEGDLTKNVPPGVHELRFDPRKGVLKKTRTAEFNESNEIVENIKPTTHHANISPDGKYIVVPSLEGRVYFVNRKKMKVQKIVQAKLGAAHVEFSDAEGVAVVTNHFDNFLTIIDMETLEVKKQLQIGFDHDYDKDDKHLLQPHFSYIGPEGRYFYTFATQDGKFIKVDLRTLEIINVLETGGAPEQAHS